MPSLSDALRGTWVAQGLGDGSHRFAGGPREGLVVQDYAARDGAHGDAEVGGDEHPDRDLPPCEIEPNVALEDHIDVVERRQDDAHEPDASDGADHRLDDVELVGELRSGRALLEERGREEHAGVGEVHAHAELEGGVGHGRRRDDAEERSQKKSAPVEPDLHDNSRWKVQTKRALHDWRLLLHGFSLIATFLSINVVYGCSFGMKSLRRALRRETSEKVRIPFRLSMEDR